VTVIDRGIEYEDEDAEFFRDGTVRDATLSHDVVSCLKLVRGAIDRLVV
jgi:hypothetical protein